MTEGCFVEQRLNWTTIHIYRIEKIINSTWLGHFVERKTGLQMFWSHWAIHLCRLRKMAMSRHFSAQACVIMTEQSDGVQSWNWLAAQIELPVLVGKRAAGVKFCTQSLLGLMIDYCKDFWIGGAGHVFIKATVMLRAWKSFSLNFAECIPYCRILMFFGNFQALQIFTTFDIIWRHLFFARWVLFSSPMEAFY